MPALKIPHTFELRPTASGMPKGTRPDELMIDWGNVPSGSTAEIYLPAVGADAIIAMADALYTSHLLKRADAHTVRCPAAGVTYMPIPSGQAVSFAGLLTLDLPAGIHKGETYAAVIRQFTSVGVAGTGNTVNATNLAGSAAARRLRQWRRTTGTRIWSWCTARL